MPPAGPAAPVLLWGPEPSTAEYTYNAITSQCLVYKTLQCLMIPIFLVLFTYNGSISTFQVGLMVDVHNRRQEILKKEKGERAEDYAAV